MSLIILSGAPSIKRKLIAKQISVSLGKSFNYYYCFTDYSLPRVDCGILPTTTPFKKEYEYILEIANQDVIIGGTFSKCFIDRVCADVLDVQIINIVRHPTVSYLMNIVNTEVDEESPVGLRYTTPLTTSSILDNITLSNLDYVTTIKFEDMLKSGEFRFAGRCVQCPVTNYNGIISRYEYFYNKPKLTVGQDDIDQFDNVFSNMNSSFINNHNDQRLPNNVFDLLGYKLLTYKDIFTL